MLGAARDLGGELNFNGVPHRGAGTEQPSGMALQGWSALPTSSRER